MARPTQPLKKRYGKLTVRTSVVLNGRRQVAVVCACGVRKWVLADALRAGRVASCGAPACRKGKASVKVDPTYNPRGPAVITMRQLASAYRRFDKHLASATSLAIEYDVNYNTLYSMIRNVRRAGGIEAYRERVGA